MEFCVMCVIALVCYNVICWLRQRPFIEGITKKAVFITGCDSGLGRAAALYLDGKGVPVFAGCLTQDGATSLKSEASQRLYTVQLDISQEDSVQKAFQFVLDHLPKDGTKLWGVINNAGVLGVFAPIDFKVKSDFAKVMDVNFLGTVSVTLTFLQEVKRSCGRIINMASVIGFTPAAHVNCYGASKFALEGFSDGIRLELQPWKVKVAVIEPTGFKTDIYQQIVANFTKFWNRFPSLQEEYGQPYYDKVIEAFTKRSSKHHVSRDLDIVAKAMEHALFAVNPKSHYTVGPGAWLFKFVIFYTPRWFADWVTVNFFTILPLSPVKSNKE